MDFVLGCCFVYKLEQITDGDVNCVLLEYFETLKKVYYCFMWSPKKKKKV